MKEKPIKCSRELWDKMRMSTKRKIYDKVEVIDSEEVKEKDDC